MILVPGPAEEIETVNRIYRLFVEDGRYEAEIAEILNADGLSTDLGRPWTRGVVHQVLSNEKYIGNNVYNRVSFKLKRKRVVNPPEMWVRAEGAFECIVDVSLFYAAQGIIRERARRYSDDDMLGLLKRLYERRGWLSGLIIDETEDMPSSGAYQCRFGSLLRAYQLVGYTPERDYRYVEINKRLRRLFPEVVEGAMREMRDLGAEVRRDLETDLIVVNEEFTVSAVIARCLATRAGSARWNIRLDTGLRPDVTVAIRMAPGNETVLDYYLLPTIDVTAGRLRLAEDNGIGLDMYRFETLDYLFGMAERVSLREAA